MKPMKTPGVYIVEKNAFPNSVVQVATAVPAFIGYTEKAMNGNVSLANAPWRISSMSEFHSYFGEGPTPEFSLGEAEEYTGGSALTDGGAQKKDPLPAAEFTVTKKGKTKKYALTQTNEAFALYGAMRLFFQNGGGACYVVSIGSYEDQIDGDKMLAGIKTLIKEAEPTMVVIPEATRLTRANCQKVQQAMLMHCGDKMKNRFAVLDMFAGHLDRQAPQGDPVAGFRNDIGINHLDFGAAYYPWINTSIFQSRNFTFQNIAPASRPDFIKLLKDSANPDGLPADKMEPQFAEIARTDGKPVLAGSLALVTTKGATTPLTPQILRAEGYEIDDEHMTFTIADGATLLGQISLTSDLSAAITTFTQEQVMAGEVVHIQNGTDTSGSFSVTAQTIVDDMPVGNASDPATVSISVVAARGDLAVMDSPEGVTVNVLENDESGADPTTVKLVDPDESAADGKTKTVSGVGVWSVDTTSGNISFKPEDGFKGPEAMVKYTVSVSGTESPPADLKVYLGAIPEPEDDMPSVESVDKTLRVIAPVYGDMMDAITARMNAMPPAAAMAGIYTMVDSNRGVWKAPANVSLNSVVSPMVNISHDEQEDLNVTPQGKSVNAIRPFVGEGTLVWGARTLDGNSLDWRYINVRRTMIMMEESIKLASKAYVFEPNTANTWITMKSMIENFLTGIWKQGGLAGAVPADAFSVHVGLGETMTPVDILEGILRITVLVAVVRPAEFIEITFQQQMQKS